MAVGLLAAGGRSAAKSTTDGGDQQESRLISAIDAGLAQANAAAGSASEAAMGLSERAGNAVERAKGSMQSESGSDGGAIHSLVAGQPVMAGVAALGLGLAIGLSLPATEAERGTADSLRAGVQDRLDAMGLPTDPASMLDSAKGHIDTLTTQAKETTSAGVTQAKQAATELVGHAKQTASDAASERGLTS